MPSSLALSAADIKPALVSEADGVAETDRGRGTQTGNLTGENAGDGDRFGRNVSGA